MTGNLIGIGDLSLREIDDILDRAEELRTGGLPNIAHRFIAATVFLSPSLRTRVGFSAATHRLGGSVINVTEVRDDTTMSAGESFADTLRGVAGMVDVVITRTPFELAAMHVARLPASVVNGGDGAAEHPTQALIDLSAMEAYAGPIGGLRLAICGDLTMRAVTSLLRLLGRRPPASLTLISPPSRRHRTTDLTAELSAVTGWSDRFSAHDVDVLYLPGLPMRKADDVLSDDRRAEYAYSAHRAAELPGTSIVLSPMPVIDEIDPAHRSDPRIRMFDQSDRGVAVRMAVLEHVMNKR